MKMLVFIRLFRVKSPYRTDEQTDKQTGKTRNAAY